MDFIKEKIRVSAEKLASLSEQVICEPQLEYLACGYKKDNTIPGKDAGWLPLPRGARLGGKEKHFWLHFHVDAIPRANGKELFISLTTGLEGQWNALNPQGLVFLDGKAVHALDTNHTCVPTEWDREYEVYIYLYCGMKDGLFDVLPQMIARDTDVYSLYWDIKVPYEAMNTLGESSYDYVKIRDVLDMALLLMDFRYPDSPEFRESVKRTASYLKKELYTKLASPSAPIVSCIGHTHIDVAWKWTVAQTREKAERTFSTVLSLMRRYPEFKFMSSQPQLFEFIKEANPEMYAEIKERVKEGRFEVEGAMWLEADTNLISGESLVRQILFGKRFLRAEFGIESRALWLPDVFGYSAALPQILRKSGIDRFFTAKLFWSESNKVPHDIFMWRGIDGSEIFTSIARSYIRKMTPESIYDTWRDFRDKSLTGKVISTFGYGDGGGGPTFEMLEYHKRLKYGLPGMPRTVIEKAMDCFDTQQSDFEKNTKALRKKQKWSGELYLEMHRGTYTSIAKNKKNNRKSELLYQEAETLSVLDTVLLGGAYDSETFARNIKNILLNQFHDIIPGSSIKEVYEVTDAEYERILREGRAIADEKLNRLAENVNSRGGVLVYNPTPFAKSDIVRHGGKTYYAENVPAHGYRVTDREAELFCVHTGERVIENGIVRVTFDEKYQISSVYDIENEREIIPKGERANRLEIFEDMPRAYDAWEITSYYKQKKWLCDDVSAVEKTPRGFRITRKYQTSRIIQDISLRPGSRRIDFATEIDWHEDHVLLKAVFPLDIHSERATYDIQFGNIERPTHANTSWDEAKFEVCAHKWADLSETGYGVSLLNDCKYGYSCEENVLSLSLLKAATDPNPEADRGHHSFTYSLYPHTGDFRVGGTVRESYLLNMPLETRTVTQGNGKLPEIYSAVSCDKENIVIETIKKAEDSDDVIVRLFDAWNCRTRAALTFGFDFKEAYICDLMEENDTRIPHEGRNITLDVKNFEIVTLKLVK